MVGNTETYNGMETRRIIKTVRPIYTLLNSKIGSTNWTVNKKRRIKWQIDMRLDIILDMISMVYTNLERSRHILGQLDRQLKKK